MSEILKTALIKRDGEYGDAIDRAEQAMEQDPACGDTMRLIREARELVRCLRRVVPQLTVRQIHKAFGAPGDFGYDTPIGDALYATYSQPAQPAPDTDRVDREYAASQAPGFRRDGVDPWVETGALSVLLFEDEQRRLDMLAAAHAAGRQRERGPSAKLAG